MSISQLQLERYETNFLNSIRAKATRRLYQFYFNKYAESIGKDNLLLGDSKIIESQVIDFLFSLRGKGLTSSSLKGYFCAIAHFYIMNDILLNRKKIIKFINTDERKKHKNTGYTNEQIHKLLDVCDERTKAIILIYASTGIRLAALTSLKIGDLKRVKSDDFELFQITVYEGYKEEYITFCTPECTMVIDSYLEYRKRCGEELKQNSPLIREQFDSSDSLKVKYARDVSLSTIAKILKQKIVQVGLTVQYLYVV